MWDLSSLTRDRTSVPWIGRQIPNHWTTREAPTPIINVQIIPDLRDALVRKRPNKYISSVAQSCPTLCSTPGLPVHQQLPEFTQTHVHGVGDAIQLSHPLPSPSLPAFNLYQHQGLFQ